MIRPATAADADAIATIWAPHIAQTTVILSETPRDAALAAGMIADRQARGRAFLVIEEAGTVVGFASYDQFRPQEGYAHCMEHSIMLAEEASGRGLAHRLMDALEDHARAAGVHVLVGAITADNVASLRFHAARGFSEVARMPEVGRKFDRWQDLVLMQKIL